MPSWYAHFCGQPVRPASAAEKPESGLEERESGRTAVEVDAVDVRLGELCRLCELDGVVGGELEQEAALDLAHALRGGVDPSRRLGRRVPLGDGRGGVRLGDEEGAALGRRCAEVAVACDGGSAELGGAVEESRISFKRRRADEREEDAQHHRGPDEVRLVLGDECAKGELAVADHGRCVQ